jgi:hypothetical protein
LPLIEILGALRHLLAAARHAALRHGNFPRRAIDELVLTPLGSHLAGQIRHGSEGEAAEADRGQDTYE